jgi:protein-disulfide isomerase
MSQTLSPVSSLAIAAVALAAVASAVGCARSGTCEYRYDQASHDGSIPEGLEPCMDGWVEEKCNGPALASASQGLKTSGHTFTKGATCAGRGFKECAAGRGIDYRTCPADMPRAEKPAPAAPGPLAAPGAREPGRLTAPIAVPDDAPSRGPADAKVVMQVFCDDQDPFTARLWRTLDERFQNRPDLRIVFRHNPLPFHEDAPLAHQAALEALAQKGPDGFWMMQSLLLASTQTLDRASLVRYAKASRLDVAAFEKALDAGTHAARVEQDVKAAVGAGLRSSPILVIGTRVLRGAQPAEAIDAFIAGAP